MARKKREEHEEHVNHERWLVSYADMVTLLMCVFIVLFAMATVDASKFAALKDSLAGKKSEQSVLEGSQSVVEGGQISKLTDDAATASPSFETPDSLQSFDAGAAKKALQSQQAKVAAEAKEKANLEQAREEIQAALDARGMGDKVQFQLNQRGLVITIVADKVLFDSGKATVRPEGQTILEALGEPLALLPNDISIEGHTDNVPISSAMFPTNWELSGARAASVLRNLVDHEGVSANRVGAVGYGEMRPAVPNDSDAHRSQNRRVEIVVLATSLDQAATAGVSTTAPATTTESSAATTETTIPLFDDSEEIPASATHESTSEH